MASRILKKIFPIDLKTDFWLKYRGEEIHAEAMKILVVDDEALVRDIVRKGLSKMGGYDVEVAQNGLEAIEKMERDVFDLVLTDLKMPEMDGIELLKTIKGTRPEMMVILMTAYGSIETAVEAMKMGANDYITKPVDFNDLLIHISKAQKESRDRSCYSRLCLI